MKSISELTDFYYKDLYPELQKLEKQREKLRSRVISIAVPAGLLGLIVAYMFRDAIALEPMNLLFIFIPLTAGGAFLYSYLIKDYVEEFKFKIIRPLIKAIDDRLEYSSQNHVRQTLFERSSIFTSRIDRMSGNDYVQGMIDDTKLEFSDIHAEKRTKDSKGNDHWHTVFQGIFIVGEFNKNFYGRTVILPDSAQSTFGDLFGNWLQSKNMQRDELVKMDSPDFEKEFVVYSDNQVEARYILSHTLMQKLLTFKKKSEHPISVSFVQNHIHIAVAYNKDLFEPSVFHSLLKYKIAMEYVKTLHLAIGIVEELKLNQKLWSKR